MTTALTSRDDAYTTNPSRSSFIYNALPSLYFYFKMLKVVARSSRKAKKGEFTGDEWIKSSLDIIQNLETVGCRFFVNGKQNFISLGRPCVFVANHMSTLETFALAAIIRPHQKLTFVVKDSLVRYPVFKHIMISRDPVVVFRKNPRQDFKVVMEQGSERLSRGISVVVFPQSVRTPGIDPEKFNSIGVKLARKSGVPLVPLALKTDAWGTGWPVKDFGRIRPQRFIHFSFGPPLHIQGSGREEHRRIVNYIAGSLEKWKEP